jgi:hypothetical protein
MNRSDETIVLTVERFIAHKRALGRKYLSEERELRLLLRFAADRDVTELVDLTPVVLDDFLASRPRSRPRSFNHLLGAVRCLLDWAVSQQLLEISPLRARRRRVTSSRIPYLFDAVHARRLLNAAGQLPDNNADPPLLLVMGLASLLASPAARRDLPDAVRALLRARAACRRGVRPADRRCRQRPRSPRREGREVREESARPAWTADRRAGRRAAATPMR